MRRRKKGYVLSPSNSERAQWAQAALIAFQHETRTDDADALADLLCDLRHYAQQAGLDFSAENRRALFHFNTERKGIEL